MANMNEFLSKRNRLFWGVVGIIMVIVLGLIDDLTGYELAFSLFYLIPIAAVAWYAGRRLGLVVSAASAIAWFVADVLGGNIYLHPAIYLWNTIIRVAFFVVVTSLVAALHQAFETNEELARVDFITGAMSVRYFYERAGQEIERSRRKNVPFSLAYLDLDNFKQVNDHFGHSVGDEVLQVLVRVTRCQIRSTDMLARLGGDEFVLLLPETGEEAARMAITRVFKCVIQETQSHGWPVTVSIGVVTFNRMPNSVDEMIRAADNAMYSVKNTGKNDVVFMSYK
jgi:diguanylate cyclase (GGDEF)-like protein